MKPPLPKPRMKPRFPRPEFRRTGKQDLPPLVSEGHYNQTRQITPNRKKEK